MCSPASIPDPGNLHGKELERIHHLVAKLPGLYRVPYALRPSGKSGAEQELAELTSQGERTHALSEKLQAC